MRKRLIFASFGIGIILLGFLFFASRGLNKPRLASVQRNPDHDRLVYQAMGTAMDPTIKDGDKVVLRAHIREARRGEIVVFKHPEDEAKIICRRVLGVEGDRLVTKYYSNVKITTNFSKEHPEGVDFPTGVTPKGEVYREKETVVEAQKLFVTGDNAVPGASYDSDEWGLLPIGNVIGIVKR